MAVMHREQSRIASGRIPSSTPTPLPIRGERERERRPAVRRGGRGCLRLHALAARYGFVLLCAVSLCCACAVSCRVVCGDAML